MKFLTKSIQKFNKTIAVFTKKQLRIMLCFILAASIIGAAMDYLAVTRNRSMTVTLNYEYAKQGLNPDGSRFNIADIKSDEVLKSAIGILGNNKLNAASVRDRIYIDSKMPLSAIDKTKAAIASGSTYSYNPSEFEIYYSQKNKLRPNHSVKFLEALSKAYNDYFMTTYSDKNVILEFDGADDFEDYDYYEIFIVLENKMNSMISYLGNRDEENNAYRSPKTGYTFENLTNMLLNLRDKDLNKLEAYVVQNAISENTSEFISKQQYLIEKGLHNYNSNMQASDISKDALLLYDPHITGIAFIPTVDSDREYYMSRTKTGIDNLTMHSYDSGVIAKGFKKNLDKREYLVNKFSAYVPLNEKSSAQTADEAKASDAPNPSALEVADKMIVDICVYLEKISSLAVLTDNDYISYKTNNYITFSLPSRTFYVPVISFAVCLVLSSIVAYLAGILYIQLIKKKKSPYSTQYINIEEEGKNI